MEKLTDKQEQVDWSHVSTSMQEWRKYLMSNMSREKFIELLVGKWASSESKEDELLRK